MTTERPPTESDKIRVAYDSWMESEGIPIHTAAAAVADVAELPREPWPRMGGKGTFVQLNGIRQADRGCYLVEIPGAGALNPEKHLYDEVIYVMEGRGLTEIWQEGGQRSIFEWGPGSIFPIPVNVWHRLVNGSQEPVLILAFTRAPRLFKLFNNADFIFNCDYRFLERYGGESDYFNASETRTPGSRNQSVTWFTNFIPDVTSAAIDPMEMKVAGGDLTSFSMGYGFPHGHISGWPVGRYHKAHYHGPGAIIVGLSGKGFVVLWPKELGLHPFQDGYENEVVMVDWGPRSIYAPPDAWFHQHMSTGAVPARHWAIHGDPLSFSSVSEARQEEGRSGVMTSIREGGQLIDYEDEDPEVRRQWEMRCRAEGVEPAMPAVEYRTDPVLSRI